MTENIEGERQWYFIGNRLAITGLLGKCLNNWNKNFQVHKEVDAEWSVSFNKENSEILFI